jgi:hypothetical protein
MGSWSWSEALKLLSEIDELTVMRLLRGNARSF